MTGDEMARTFDKLIAEFLDAVARREALGLPLPKGATRDPQMATLAPWFASKDGRSKVKKALAALKAERAALKAAAKFARKSVKEPDAQTPSAVDATTSRPVPAAASSSGAAPAAPKARAVRSPKSKAPAAPAAPAANRGRAKVPDKAIRKPPAPAQSRTSSRAARGAGGRGKA